MQFSQFPMPTRNKNHLLIQVHSVALNPVDYKLPKLLGSLLNGKYVASDFSGTVLEAPNGGEFKPGDEVFGMSQGSLAEYIQVDP